VSASGRHCDSEEGREVQWEKTFPESRPRYRAEEEGGSRRFKGGSGSGVRYQPGHALSLCTGQEGREAMKNMSNVLSTVRVDDRRCSRRVSVRLVTPWSARMRRTSVGCARRCWSGIVCLSGLRGLRSPEAIHYGPSSSSGSIAAALDDRAVPGLPCQGASNEDGPVTNVSSATGVVA
jgi:hypothetical protein